MVIKRPDSDSAPAVTPLVTDPADELGASARAPRERGKLADQAVKGVRVLLGVLMLALVGLISVEVMLRYFLNLPLDSVTEVASFLFIWLAMLGAAAAVPLGAHMAIHPLRRHEGAIVKASVQGVMTLATLAFGVFLTVSGYQFATSLSDETLPVTGIQSIWEAAAFPVSGALMLGFTLLQAVRDLRRLSTGGKDRDAQAKPTPLRNS